MAAGKLHGFYGFKEEQVATYLEIKNDGENQTKKNPYNPCNPWFQNRIPDFNFGFRVQCSMFAFFSSFASLRLCASHPIFFIAQSRKAAKFFQNPTYPSGDGNTNIEHRTSNIEQKRAKGTAATARAFSMKNFVFRQWLLWVAFPKCHGKMAYNWSLPRSRSAA